MYHYHPYCHGTPLSPVNPKFSWPIFPTSPLRLNPKLEDFTLSEKRGQILIVDEITLPENTPQKCMMNHRRKMSRFLTAECICTVQGCSQSKEKSRTCEQGNSTTEVIPD